MANLASTIKAKSDQLNAVDIVGFEPVITIERVVETGKPDQPIAIYYQGCNNRPWKPSLGMRRILATLWGAETELEDFVGRKVKLFNNPKVKWAGKECGGIWIRAMSHIERNFNTTIPVARNKREPIEIEVLTVEVLNYPDDKFDAGYPAMKSALESKKMSLPQVISQCQKTGNLTQRQLHFLEKCVPVEE